MRTFASLRAAAARRPTAGRRTCLPPAPRQSCRSPTDTESGVPPPARGAGCLFSPPAPALGEPPNECGHFDGGFRGFPALVGRAFTGALERLFRGIGRENAERHRD